MRTYHASTDKKLMAVVLLYDPDHKPLIVPTFDNGLDHFKPAVRFDETGKMCRNDDALAGF